MLKRFRVVVLAGALAVGGMVAGASTAGAALPSLTCTGGLIPAGNYSTIRITGICELPTGPTAGAIVVRRNLVVAANAALNAVTDANLVVWGDVRVGRNAIVGIGCNTMSVGSPPNGPCDVNTTDYIGGDFEADGAAAVILHTLTIGGDLTVEGGGGGVNCNPNAVLDQFAGPGTPLYFTAEDGRVSGDVSITDIRSCWAGFFREIVSGGVTIAHNRFADPDATEVKSNVIAGYLACFANSPHAQGGDSQGTTNIVAGQKKGECVNQ